MKILIVEDDRATARLYGEWLIKAGHEVKGAVTGAEALAQVGLWNPEGVLLDLMLPDINGLEVLKRIRSEAPNFPVVVCTNGFVPALVDEARASGAALVFDKSMLTALDLVMGFNQVAATLGSDRSAA